MALTKTDLQWIETTLAGLSAREKLGQIMIPRLTPHTVEPYGGVGKFIEATGVGGCHAFGGDMTKARKMIAEAHAASKVPLLITGDLERGIGQRVEGGVEFAGQLALGACDDQKLAYRFGEAIGVQGTAAGYNWAFGPVVDLSLHPGNLSTIRCLGSDPEKVSRLAAALIHGIQDHGMAATAKHLPGAGTDDLDSHLTTSVNHQGKRQWRRLSGLPFQAAVDAGVWAIMSSPKACPGIDPECGDPLFPRPVMTSKAVCTDLLRGEMGFDGLLVTDAVTMAGLTMHFRRLEMHLACLKAGNDMLLFVRRLESLYDYLEQCLSDGRLKEERLNEAVRRVLTLKAKVGLHVKPPMLSDTEYRKVFSHSPYAADAERLAEKSITLLRDRGNIVPLKARPGLKIASVLITNRPEFKLDLFEQGLREAGCVVTSFKNPEQETLYDRIEGGEWEALVIGLYYPPQWGWSTARCHGPEARCLMDGFPFARADVPAVFISWANPYHLYEFGFMDPYLVTYGGADGTQRATARALVGRIPIVGRSPVALEPFFKVGDGLRRRARKS